MSTTGRLSSDLSTIVILILASAVAADLAAAPRRLNEVAASITLREDDTTGDGTVTITNRGLVRAGEGGVVSTGGVTRAVDDRDPASEETLRERWRQRYHRQAARVSKAQGRLAEAELRVEAARRARHRARPGSRQEVTAGERLAVAEARRAAAVDELARERRELGHLVRRARREGAQPGWFR